MSDISCPRCGQPNEYATEEGAVEGPRGYHAECWAASEQAKEDAVPVYRIATANGLYYDGDSSGSQTGAVYTANALPMYTIAIDGIEYERDGDIFILASWEDGYTGEEEPIASVEPAGTIARWERYGNLHT